MAYRMVDVITLIDEIAVRRVDACLEDLLLQRSSRQPAHCLDLGKRFSLGGEMALGNIVTHSGA
jgi:hypothetical protein